MKARFLLLLVLVLAIFTISGCIDTTEPGIVNVSMEDEGDTGDAGMEDVTGDVVAEEEAMEGPEETMEEEEAMEEEDVSVSPSEDGQYRIEVVEGDLVSLKPRAVDPDNDDIRYMYTAPLDSDGRWQTGTGDAGRYLIEVTATDGKLSTTQSVLLIVKSANKAPKFTNLEDVTVRLGETVELDLGVSDPEGDQIDLTYSGWMDSDTYTTVTGDEGRHRVRVTASDGINSVTESIFVIVEKENTAPKITSLSAEDVLETETLIIDVNYEDSEGDDVEIIFPAPFNDEGEWETKVGDAGTYRVVVTASDGEKTSSEDIIVTIEALNKAPVITGLDDIEVDEGETVELDYTVSDPDGDDVTVTISGWMDSDTKDTDFGDAGDYDVTVTASDGQLETSKTISVTVGDVNRPPQFVDIVQG